MIELAIPKVISGTIATAIIVAVIDPAITSIALAVIAAAVVITPLWFKYQIDKQNKKIKEVIDTSDGMKDALVKATGDAKLAEGVLTGLEQAKTEAALKSVARIEGATQEKVNEALRQMEPTHPVETKPKPKL